MSLTRSLFLSGALAFAGAAMTFGTTANAAPLNSAPAIFPAPVSLKLTGTDISLGKSVVLVRAGYVDAETETLVRQVMNEAGVETIRRRRNCLPGSTRPMWS